MTATAPDPSAAAPVRGLLALLAGAALSGFDAGAVGFVLPAMRAATGADAASAWTGWLGVQLRDARDGARVILAARLAGGVAQAAALAMALRATR